MNEQAKVWGGAFGEEYSRRSPGDVEANAVMFARVLGAMESDPKEVIEFGAGMGANLLALRELLPQAHLMGVELNGYALRKLREEFDDVYSGSMLDFIGNAEWDLAFTKGCLIHIHPDNLPRAYEVLYKASFRYIMVAEYFSPRHEEIEYRGRRNMLWKGPYAYDMLDRYPDLKLVEYGFVSKRDRYPQDDLNWFLLEKRHAQ